MEDKQVKQEELKKENFFISLFSGDGKISSKRFGGLYLILTGGATQILSVFRDISETAVDFGKFALIVGAALLGINIASEVAKAFMTKK